MLIKDSANNIEKRTFEELEVDYDNDIEKFLENLESRLDIAEYLNNKYSVNFKPINTDYILEQYRILTNFKEDNKIKDKALIDKLNKDKDYDSVNNPYHYTSGKYECIEVMRDTFGDEKLKAWCILNAFKYLFRCYKKNGDEDLKKANFYLNYIIKNEL